MAPTQQRCKHNATWYHSSIHCIHPFRPIPHTWTIVPFRAIVMANVASSWTSCEVRILINFEPSHDQVSVVDDVTSATSFKVGSAHMMKGTGGTRGGGGRRAEGDTIHFLNDVRVCAHPPPHTDDVVIKLLDCHQGLWTPPCTERGTTNRVLAVRAPNGFSSTLMPRCQRHRRDLLPLPQAAITLGKPSTCSTKKSWICKTEVKHTHMEQDRKEEEAIGTLRVGGGMGKEKPGKRQ